MKDSKVYQVAFIVVLCCVCAAVLTFANTQWAKRIAANENYAKINAVVDALGLIGEAAERDAVIGAYDAAVSLVKKGDMDYYEARQDGKLTGYAMEIIGRGKYGPIKGILAIGPGKQKILNLRIYEQNETPGLGGRITSLAWLGQFTGKALITGGVPGLLFDAKKRGPNVIRPVSGASKTMYSISKIINKAIAQFLAGGAALDELDLGLTPDAITRVTPGYPKNQPKPPHLREEVKRPPFMVPKGGTVNLALKTPVTCSMEDEPIIGELSQITDGVLKSGQFDYVELDPGPQYL